MCEIFPHCGGSLNPWERKLLDVDPALMCKCCRHRIIPDAGTCAVCFTA